MKHLLTVNTGHNGIFIMDNNIGSDGKPIGQIGPYYPTIRAATIAMMEMPEFTNIYDMSQKDYKELVR